MTHRSARALFSLVLVSLVWSGVPSAVQARPAVVRSAKSVSVKRPPVIAPSAVPKAPAAQPTPLVAKRPWLYENSDVPIDTQWLFGTLPNGLRYAIRNNGVPPGQVSIRLRVDAGSLMERDDERGFAHFMEHLTFRGSKYVPDGESKRIWQRLGVSFGSDSNAQTTPTGTTYALDLPQATPNSLNESMKILAGMMSDPNIVPAAVDAERAVVLAEMREGMGPRTKVGDATRALYFAGQALADRSPIGTAASLSAARAEALQAFHDRWYRPENAVIAISGDIDRKQAEALIQQNFASWQGKGQATPHPDFGKPDPKAPSSAVVVQAGVPTALSLAWLRPWRPKADTVVYNQGKLTDMVALQLINRRLEQAARGAASFLSANVDVQDVSRSVDGTFVSIVPAGKDWQKALNDVRAVIEDAKATAPTEQEIAREYAQFDTALAVMVENQDTEASAKQASDITSAVDIRETTVSAQAALEIFRSAKTGMTPQRMLESTRRMFTGDATRAMLILPVIEAGAEQKLATTLATPVAAASNIRLTADAAKMDDLPKLGPPGKVVSRDTTILGMQIITFDNGVKLTLFANNAETGKVRVNVRFGHGQQDLSPKQTVPSGPAPYILGANGIGKLGQRELDELTNGRRLGFDFNIDDDAFEMAALTRPADYKDQLRLFATKLAAPGWDPAPIERTKAALIAAEDTNSGSPDAVLGRDLMWLLRNKDARFLTPGAKEIAALTPAAFRAQWEPILASGPIEVQLFGDVNADDAVATVAATFGALPPRSVTKPAKANRTLKFPSHNRKPLVLTHDGDPDQAAATIAWPTGSGFGKVQDARRLDVLAQIIGDRLFEKLRSVDGASYSPQAQSNWPFAYERSKGYLVVTSQLKPERIDYFYKLIGDVVTDLAAKPVSADELQRVTAPMRQLLTRASTGNVFWMNQMEGATRDPRYIAITQTLGADILGVKAEDIQALAKKYLRLNKSFSVVVLPKQAAAKP